jgi:hypothetical protein
VAKLVGAAWGIGQPRIPSREGGGCVCVAKPISPSDLVGEVERKVATSDRFKQLIPSIYRVPLLPPKVIAFN